MPSLSAKVARELLVELPGMTGSNSTLKMADAIRGSMRNEVLVEHSVPTRQSVLHAVPWFSLAAGAGGLLVPLGMKGFAMNGWKKIMSNRRGCANLSLQFTAWDAVR